MTDRVSPTSPATARWSPADLAGIAAQQGAGLPLLSEADARPVLPMLDLWDMWQLQHADGRMALIGGREYWFFLATPRLPDPEDRHDHARIRLLSRSPGAGDWRDHGNVLPDGLNPGTREWSGSAVLEADGQTISLYYTAAGWREGGPRFGQRLFVTQGRLDAAAMSGWTTPRELFGADGLHYRAANEDAPSDGMILGFRDPGFFRDPANGREYLLFTGSAPGTQVRHDGVIGIARRDGAGWRPLPPLVDATGTNKELERPHLVFHAGRYYLFWCTHAARFAPGIVAPTGLYGMVAEDLRGPWRPLNGTTLVAANPADEPMQAYCWWVTAEREVISFVDYRGVGPQGPADGAEARRAHFGGSVAPGFQLLLDGDRATIARAAATP